MAFRHGFFWLMMVSACALAAGPAGSAAKRTISALHAAACWKAALASDRPIAAQGEPSVWISIPSIGLGLPALQGATEENLQKFPGVVAWPVREEPPSLTVILGHRDTHFRPLENLRKNASITLTFWTGVKREFRVTAVDILDPVAAQKKIQERAGRDDLVLMTCYPFRYLGPAPKRILIWASR